MSLRVATSLALVAMLLIVGAVAGATAWGAAASEAGQFMDDQMRQLASLVDETTSPGLLDGLDEPEGRFAVTVWKDGAAPLVLSPPAADARPGNMGFSTRRGAEDWRTYASRRGDLTILVAQRVSARTEVAAHAALQVALPILAIAPLASLIVFAVAGRLLRPLTRLGEEIDASRPERIRALPVARLPVEVAPFVTAINGLVGRMQDAVAQQRRFVADSAHQLRTPLAAMRLQVDNLARASRLTAGEVAPLRDGMARVAAMIGQLLALARLEGTVEASAAEPFVLAALVAECVADHIVIADDKGVDLGVDLDTAGRTDGTGSVTPVQVRLVRADVGLLLANVVENAVRCTPSGGRIDCSLGLEEDGDVLVVVEDTGPGVAEVELALLTERFFRGAAARDEGSGLGLAIAKAAADRNGLALSFRNRRDGSGLRVAMRVPATAVLAQHRTDGSRRSRDPAPIDGSGL